jgi:thiol-disulfide isomerase/thioredoxin
MDIENNIKNNNIVVVKIGATWCGPCQSEKLKNKYNELQNTFSSKVIFFELDVNKHEELMSNKLFATNSIPNFKLFISGEKKLDLMGIDAIQKIEETLLELNI